MTCLDTLWTLSRSSGPPSRLWVCQGSRSEGGPGWGFTVTLVSDSLVVALLWPMSSGGCRVVLRRDVSATTACKWWQRWSQATPEQRKTLACLEDRSSRPQRSPGLLPPAEQARICAARRRFGWGPRLIGGETGHPHATVWRTLKRAGISRPQRQAREQPRLYEWPCPGDLLHIDSKRFVRFTRPGHALTGDR
jgi:hypothetical protein